MANTKFRYAKVDKEKLIEDLFESPYLNKFFIDNDLTSDTVEENILTFMNFNIEKNRCIECNGLTECTQDNKGLEPVIKYVEGKVRYSYKECPYLVRRKEISQQDENITSMHLPSSILEASLEDFDFNRGENKVEVLNKMTNFITLLRNGEKPNGMFLYGKNNVGKTYCMSALATELKSAGHSVIIAYYPDLVREFKSNIGNSSFSLEETISKLKQVEVLMLDDIGGEGTSVWVRDEILGPILQYRLLDNKATFFTSNYSIRRLAEEHYSKFSNDPSKINGARIGIRIKNLVKENEIKM